MNSNRVLPKGQEVIIIDDSDEEETQPDVCETEGETFYKKYLEEQKLADYRKARGKDLKTEDGPVDIIDRSMKSDNDYFTFKSEDDSKPRSNTAMRLGKIDDMKSENDVLAYTYDDAFRNRAVKPDELTPAKLPPSVSTKINHVSVKDELPSAAAMKIDDVSVKQEQSTTTSSISRRVVSLSEHRRLLKIQNRSPERRKRQREREDEIFGDPVIEVQRFIERSQRSAIDNALMDFYATEEIWKKSGRFSPVPIKPKVEQPAIPIHPIPKTESPDTPEHHPVPKTEPRETPDHPGT
jgi:hypothetical protein